LKTRRHDSDQGHARGIEGMGGAQDGRVATEKLGSKSVTDHKNGRSVGLGGFVGKGPPEKEEE